MAFVELSLCPRIVFDIRKCSCCGSKKNSYNKKFKLLKKKQRMYINLIPRSGIFFYMKILYDGTVLCVAGKKLLKTFGFNIKNIGKTLEKLREHILFREFIGPVFEQCIKDNEIYQFDFNFDDRADYSCCIYPCIIQSIYVSVDVVVRMSHHMTEDDVKEFKIDNNIVRYI